MSPRKTVYYTDELHDDFADTKDKIIRRRIDGDYRYERSGIYRFFSQLLYRCIVTPLVFLYCKLFFGARFKNRRVLKQVEGGFFLYGNHTQNVIDAFLPSLVTFPKQCSIITGPEAASIPVIRHIVPMLGGIPVGTTARGLANFTRALRIRVNRSFPETGAVAVYPEAHIWPYYNGIRPFPEASFKYPVRMNKPAVGFCVTYRPRRIFKKLHPFVTVTVSEPVYPEGKSAAEVRDLIHRFMVDTVRRENSYAYIAYERAPDEDPLLQSLHS